MIGQRKHGLRLLRTVKGKPHATQDDYKDRLQTSPATDSTRSSASHTNLIEAEEDIHRDPESSDDEKPAPPAAQKKSSMGFYYPRRDAAEDELLRPADFKLPSAGRSASRRAKRGSGSDHSSSESEAGIFSSQASPKRNKLSPAKNIHAPDRPRAKRVTYDMRRNNTQKQARRSALKPPRRQEPKPESPEGLKFQKAKGADMFEFGKDNDAPTFETARKSGDRSGVIEVDVDGFRVLSPSLSPLSSPPSSPEVEEIRDLDLPAPHAYVSMIECAICDRQVGLFLKQDFEDQFGRCEQMNYRQQERFCAWHKKHEAEQLSKELGYPEIDWDGLEKRMRRHHTHLKDVLSGTCPSVYRNQLSAKVKGRSKTAMQSMNWESGKRGALVGYYGPRGEKVM